MKSPILNRKTIPNDVDDEIRKFYECDDISRGSPKAKDVKTYTCPSTGQKVVLALRHMHLGVKEAYALFVEERKCAEKGIFLYVFTLYDFNRSVLQFLSCVVVSDIFERIGHNT